VTAGGTEGDPLRSVAVVGCGAISVIHTAAIAELPDAQLVAVCDRDPERLAVATAAYAVAGFADHRTLLDQVRPDVVHICTSHDEHVSVAIDCLARGVHVVMEKPLAHTLADGDRLVAAAEQSPAKIAVCFQNRYNTAVVAMQERLSTGELGRVLGAAATVCWHRTADYYKARPWRGSWAGSGGGLLMNQAIHTVDLLQWLLGDVSAVAGHAATRALADAIEVEDTAELALVHAGGSRTVFYGTLTHATNAPVAIDVVTEQATLSLRGDLTVSHADGRVEVVAEARTATGEHAYWGLSHVVLIRDFYDRIDEEEPFWISPREAQKSLRIVKDIYRQSYPGNPAVL
jgi:UDP-N-acetyl-2-amino-2-deoxyglucuronate dehydrogenase